MNGELIEKYYKGKCSPEEAQAVLEWFRAQNPGAEQEKDLYELWQKAELEKEEGVYAHDADKLFTGILSSINTREGKVVDFDNHKTSGGTWMRKLKVAAAVLISLCSAWLLVTLLNSTGPQLVTHETSPGERKVITLNDGSIVSLNSESSISFAKGFKGETREIVLKGEAFFDVAKDSLRPFIVQTGTISTQALGTSFNINYPDEASEISVSLATGIVRVSDKGEYRSEVLNPGEQMVYDPQKKFHMVKAFDMKEVLSWKDGVLYFKNSDMQQVISKLEKWYAVDIEVEDVAREGNDWNYTGEYNNETLENVLDGIGFVKNFTYEKQNDKIIINLD